MVQWLKLCAASAGGIGNSDYRAFFPDGTNGKESACSVEDLGLILGSGRSPGEGDGYPPQYSCLENSMERGAWWATVHRVAKNWTRLSE